MDGLQALRMVPSPWRHKRAVGTCGTDDTTALAVSQDVTVDSIRFHNYSGGTVYPRVRLVPAGANGADGHNLASGSGMANQIVAGEAVDILDKPVYLQVGDRLLVSASDATALNYVISYRELI